MFIDRIDAGRRLGERLHHLRGEDVVVAGLPRGGVPVGAQVALALEAPLDVIMVRKLGVPRQPELAMGAIGEGGVRVLSPQAIRRAEVSPAALAAVEERERVELTRRADRFRGDRPRVALVGRTVVVVDDGIATGATARAACQVVRQLGAARVVLAVPVAPEGWARAFEDVADDVVALETPRQFTAIGRCYSDFSQTTDQEVIECLQEAAARVEQAQRFDESTEVEVQAGDAVLSGLLTVPRQATGVVLFAHGTGSGSHSPRNQFVAKVLNQAGLGTLLLDLLTPEEELDRANVFDVRLLAGRLEDATHRLRSRPDSSELPIGYFGASTGAAAALWAAAESDAGVSAVVSRGGRPDLAASRLADVTAPTLLIVGGRDEVVLDLNRRARRWLRCRSHLSVVPRATHLFEEPGALETVAELARDWFTRHLAPQPAPAR
ncbi:MAG TPA: phosphoribosyltransferase [Pseudonocardiaceae bacterium]